MIERCRTTETYFCYKYLNVRCAYSEPASYLSSRHLIKPLLSYSQLDTAVSQSSNRAVFVSLKQGWVQSAFSALEKGRRRFLCLPNRLWWGLWYLHRQKQQRGCNKEGNWARLSKKRWLDPTCCFWQVVRICSGLRETTAKASHSEGYLFRKLKTVKHASALEKMPSLFLSEHQKEMLDQSSWS